MLLQNAIAIGKLLDKKLVCLVTNDPLLAKQYNVSLKASPFSSNYVNLSPKEPEKQKENQNDSNGIANSSSTSLFQVNKVSQKANKTILFTTSNKTKI